MGFSRQEYWSGLPFSSPLFRDVPAFFSVKRYFLGQSLNSGNPQGLHKIKIIDAQLPSRGSRLLNTKLVLPLGLSVMLKLTALLTFFFFMASTLASCSDAFCCPRSNFCLLFVCANHVHLFATPQTVACQAPLSLGFSRQEYWSGLPFPSPEDLPSPGMEVGSAALRVDSFPSEPPGKPSVPCSLVYIFYCFRFNPASKHPSFRELSRPALLHEDCDPSDLCCFLSETDCFNDSFLQPFVQR